MLQVLSADAILMAPKQNKSLTKNEQILNKLRAEVKQLTKVHRQQKKGAIWNVPEAVQKMAVVIQMLSDDSRWAVAWIQQWQLRHYMQTFATPVKPTHAMILMWVEQHKADTELLGILANINHPKRIVADNFLMESMLYEFVQDNSRKGIAIPTGGLITKLLKNWSFRPASHIVELQLRDLHQDKSKRTEWARRFRRKWKILWGLINKDKPQSRDLLQKKALSFGQTSNIEQHTHGNECSVRNGCLIITSGLYLPPVGTMAAQCALERQASGYHQHGRDISEHSKCYQTRHAFVNTSLSIQI